MHLFDLIKLWVPECDPTNTKIHLARWNGREDPHDEFLAGTFEDWQRWQSKDHFKRTFVLSLVQTFRGSTRWVFAGIYRPVGKTWIEAEPNEDAHYWYDLERVIAADEWVGRLYVKSAYKERQSRPTGELLADDLLIEELKPERVSMEEFPGFNKVQITMAQLDLVVKHDLASWRTALSSVKGIYVITDTQNRKIYVGKADGADGLWGRWSTYAVTGHGHNVALMEEFGISAPPDRKFDLKFSILEIAPPTATDLDQREKHWKAVLDSRNSGYNRN